MDKHQILQAFASYAKEFDNEDVKIRLKIKHMYRVADLAERIARSENMSQADMELAWLIGLLHDIGRFEQIRRYNTFVDRDSCDHAELSRAILFDDGLISHFTSRNHEIISSTIACHSLYRLPDDMLPRTRRFATILRDADKLDIFRVMTETPLEEIYNVSTDELYSAKPTDHVKQCFLEGHAVLRELKRTPIDHLIGHCCLYFELEYDESRRIALSDGYLAKMLEFESWDEDTVHWFKYMKSVIMRNYHYF